MITALAAIQVLVLSGLAVICIAFTVLCIVNIPTVDTRDVEEQLR